MEASPKARLFDGKMAIASWFTSQISQKFKKMMIKMVIFHSYVTWPKGSSKIVQRCQTMSNPHKPTIFGKKDRLLKITPLDVPKWLQLTSDYTPLRPAGKWKLEWIHRRWRCSCTSGVRSTGLTCYFLWFCHWSCVFIEDCPLTSIANVWFLEGRRWVHGEIALHLMNVPCTCPGAITQATVGPVVHINGVA